MQQQQEQEQEQEAVSLLNKRPASACSICKVEEDEETHSKILEDIVPNLKLFLYNIFIVLYKVKGMEQCKDKG